MKKLDACDYLEIYRLLGCDPENDYKEEKDRFVTPALESFGKT